MAFFTFLFSYIFYLILRIVLEKLNIITLDLFPNYYYDNPKRTWTNAGVLIICFVITTVIMYILFGDEAFSVR